MRNGLCLLILLLGLAACNDSGSTISVKTDSIGRELDTLGEKIEEKAVVVGDSVKEKFKDIKEAVTNRLDSIKQDRQK
jgi:hypothetical protein